MGEKEKQKEEEENEKEFSQNIHYREFEGEGSKYG